MLFNVMRNSEDETKGDEGKTDKEFLKQISSEKKLTKESKLIPKKILQFIFPEAEVLRNKIKFLSKMMKFNKTIRYIFLF